MSKLFTSLSLGEVTASNRIMVSPMCQYSCGRDGLPTEWHRVHLGSRAVGGAGIVMTEATAVEPRGRISPNDLGIWSEDHGDALAPIAAFIREQGSTPAIQLAHAGRKASKTRPWEGNEPLAPDEGGWETIAPTDRPYPGYDDPPEQRRMTSEDIETVVDAFVEAARRAVTAGFEIVEIHAAHGYLLHEFLSPVTNDREDDYGGDFEGRTRIVREITRAVSDAVDGAAVFVRLSATDWLPDRESWTVDQSVRLADRLTEDGADLIDVSTGGIHPEQHIPNPGPGYQIPFAERIREETDADVLVGAVGGIRTPEQADELVRNERADLAIVGREFLRDPYFPLRAADALDGELEWPIPYRRAVK